MKAIGFERALPADDPDCLREFSFPEPVPGPHDLLVAVQAVSVNPVDTKERRRGRPGPGPHVLGFDAAGRVMAIGASVRGFAPGDAVYYAGQIDRPGTNAERHLVDWRLAARAPESLTALEAAALPLTALTAWELLFDRLGAIEGGDTGASLLIFGGAGGVGSILIQLATALTGLTVIATASRPESRAWCLSLGAHHVVDHSGDVEVELSRLRVPPVAKVAILSQTARNLAPAAAALAPQGRIALIDDPPMDAAAQGILKRKSASLHWEFMFTRSLFATDDMARQGAILERLAALVDGGHIRTTLTRNGGILTPETLRAAHLAVEAGQSIGKVCLEWPPH
jgi:zinc-binding alcohol dehydrogenase family protein